MAIVIHNDTRFAHDLVYPFGNANRSWNIPSGGAITIDEPKPVIADLIKHQAKYGLVPKGTAGGSGLTYETTDE